MELELLEPPALNHSVVEPVLPSCTLEHRSLRRDDFWSAIPAYFDPLRALDAVQQARWQVASERKRMIDAALDAAAANQTRTQSRELFS